MEYCFCRVPIYFLIMFRVLSFLTLFILCLGGLPVKAQEQKSIRTVGPDRFEPIKAKIVNNDPANFTINVKFLANSFANTNAPVFAVYIDNKPEQCGDFRDIDLSYQKPSKYTRRFDLSNHPEIMTAIDRYNCVIIPNIPAK